MWFMKRLGIDWRIRADFERANRHTARHAVRCQWTLPNGCWGRNCGIVATVTIRRVTAVVLSSASCIRITPGTPIPDAVPVSLNSLRSNPMSLTGITVDLYQVAAGAAFRVKAALIANVSITRNIRDHVLSNENTKMWIKGSFSNKFYRSWSKEINARAFNYESI